MRAYARPGPALSSALSSDVATDSGVDGVFRFAADFAPLEAEAFHAPRAGAGVEHPGVLVPGLDAFLVDGLHVFGGEVAQAGLVERARGLDEFAGVAIEQPEIDGAVEHGGQGAQFLGDGAGCGAGVEAFAFIAFNVELGDAFERAGEMVEQVLLDDLRDAVMAGGIFGAMPGEVVVRIGGEGLLRLQGGVVGEQKFTTFAPGDFADFGFSQLVDGAEALRAGFARLAPGEFPVVAPVLVDASSIPCHMASSALSRSARKYWTRPITLRDFRP